LAFRKIAAAIRTLPMDAARISATCTAGMSGASASRRRFRNGFMGPPWMKTVPERDDPPRHGLIVKILRF
jgi:hypothetical protein